MFFDGFHFRCEFYFYIQLVKKKKKMESKAEKLYQELWDFIVSLHLQNNQANEILYEKLIENDIKSPKNIEIEKLNDYGIEETIIIEIIKKINILNQV